MKVNMFCVYVDIPHFEFRLTKLVIVRITYVFDRV